MKKKIYSLVQVLILFTMFLSYGLVAISNISYAEDNMEAEDGVFIGESQGHNGTIKVEVEINDGEITSINILENEETAVVAELALEEIPKEIVTHQSVEVDVVNGATISSGAIKSAVKDAIQKSGHSIDNYSEEIVKDKNEEVTEMHTQVIVIGGGGAGMSGALSADEEGYEVILLEKNGMLGGHTALSGAFTTITGSDLQKDKYDVLDDSPEAAFEDNWENGGGKNIAEDLELFVHQMGPATDWIDEYVQAPTPDSLTPLSENKIDRAMIYEGAGPGLNDALTQKIESTDIEVLLNTKADELIVEDDEVIGVKTFDQAGSEINIYSDAVLVATGSYGARKDLLPDRLQDFVYYGAQLAQGEGMEMAEAIGADTVNPGYVELFENGVEWLPGIAKSTYNGSMAAWTESGILVDLDGNRVVNERAAGIDIVKEMEQQEDSRLYLVMDKATYQVFEDNITGYGISQEMLDSWLDNNKEKTPYVATAEDLSEAAQKIGINSDNLSETVERYNQFVQDGVDSDFDRPQEFLQKEIGEGPYYIIEQLPRYATTLGGLKINDNLQVINTEGDVIPGLFAAGDVAGGARGDDSIPGADVGWALTSGYYFGRILDEFVSNE